MFQDKSASSHVNCEPRAVNQTCRSLEADLVLKLLQTSVETHSKCGPPISKISEVLLVNLALELCETQLGAQTNVWVFDNCNDKRLGARLDSCSIVVSGHDRNSVSADGLLNTLQSAFTFKSASLCECAIGAAHLRNCQTSALLCDET